MRIAWLRANERKFSFLAEKVLSTFMFKNFLRIYIKNRFIKNRYTLPVNFMVGWLSNQPVMWETRIQFPAQEADF